MQLERTGTSFDRLSRFGFLAVVFSLAFMKPSIILGGQRITVTDILFPISALLVLTTFLIGKRRFEWKPIYWLFLFYFGSLTISAVYSVDPQRSFIKLIGVGYLIGLAVLACESLTNENALRETVYAWLAGLTLSILIAAFSAIFYPYIEIFESFTYHLGAAPAGDYRRINSTFVSPAMFCNYLNVGLFLTFAAWMNGWLTNRKAVPLMVVIILTACLTVTIGIGVIFISVGVIVWTIKRKTCPKVARACLITAFLAFIPYIIVAFVTIQPYKGLPVGYEIAGFELFPSSRFLVWTDAIRTFFGDPLTGKGIGMPVANVVFRNSDGTMSLLTDAHNFILSIAAQGGLIGAVSIIGIFVYVVRLGLSKPDTDRYYSFNIVICFAFIAGFGVQGLTGSFEDARHIWVLMGLFVAADRLEASDEV